MSVFVNCAELMFKPNRMLGWPLNLPRGAGILAFNEMGGGEVRATE